MDVPFSADVGGMVCVMADLELGGWNKTDEAPPSYMTGLFSALFVRATSPRLRKESISLVNE